MDVKSNLITSDIVKAFLPGAAEKKNECNETK